MLEGGGDALTRSKSEPQSVARPPPLFLSLTCANHARELSSRASVRGASDALRHTPHEGDEATHTKRREKVTYFCSHWSRNCSPLDHTPDLESEGQARTRTRLSFERGGIVLQKLHSAQGKMKKQLKSENGGGGAHFPQPGARTADQPRAPTAPNSASTRRREEKCQNPTCAAPRLRRASMDAQASGAIDGEKRGGGRKRARAHAHERERAPRAQARPAPHADCAAVPREYTSIRNSYYSFYG